jgi:serine/threonine-protein kinase
MSGAVASYHDSHFPPEMQRDPRLGLVLAERYRIDALVDRGAMGRVYVGEHVLMHKRVAIKVLHRELLSIPEFVQRFEREAMAAANIDSEHVVAATDFGKLPDGAVFLVLEFIEGKNLRDEMLEGPMPLARALHLGRQIASALRAAHALGIVHRDLKPENVMLVERAGDPDFVKVLDFGIAKVPIGESTSDDSPRSRPLTKAGMVFGTPEYMPPEQALGQDVDLRADLYSLGVMLFEMLAGCRPFAAQSQVGVLGQQLSHKAPRIVDRTPSVFVPPAVERFVAKLLEREAAHRYQTAQEVLDAIDVHLGYGPVRPRIPTLRDGSYPDGVQTERPDDDDGTITGHFSIPGVSSPFDGVSRFVEAHRSKLPAPVRSLPAPVLLSVPLAAVGLLIGFAVVAMFSKGHADTADAHAAASTDSVLATASATPAAKPAVAPVEKSAKATKTEIDTATGEGAASLRVLAEKYPQDTTVHIALAGAALKQKEPMAAVDAIRQALAADPAVKDDSQVASFLWVLAQNKKSAEATFELLKGPMGARGHSILHDLSTTAGVRDAVKEQATAALATAAP